MSNSRTYTVEVEVEVIMTSKGYAGRAPDLNQPGEQPEPPELETGNLEVNGKMLTFMLPNFPHSLAVALRNEIEQAALNKAYDDDWADEGPDPDAARDAIADRIDGYDRDDLGESPDY